MSDTPSRRGLLAGLSFLSLLMLPAAAFADSKPQQIDLEPMPPSADVLTITAANGEVFEYDTSALEAMDTYRIVQDSQWHGDNAAYDGVLLTDLLQAHGLEDAAAIRVVAEDDYAVTFPREGIRETPILIATRVNDRSMTRRARGPFFFVLDHEAVRRARHLGEQHHIWYARQIRVATADER